MRENLKKQFKEIGDIIQSNIVTIKNLVEQTNDLDKIIHSLNSSEETNRTRDSLLEIKNNILDSIESLVEHTRQLFKTYDDLVDKVFRK